MPVVIYAERASLRDTTDRDICEALAALRAQRMPVPIVEEFALIRARRTWWRTPVPVVRYAVLWDLGRGEYQIVGFHLDDDEKTDDVGHSVRKRVILAYLNGLYTGCYHGREPIS